MSYIEVDNVKKIYNSGKISVTAVDGVTFSAEKGEIVVIVGPSGARKNYCFKSNRWNGWNNKWKDCYR